MLLTDDGYACFRMTGQLATTGLIDVVSVAAAVSIYYESVTTTCKSNAGSIQVNSTRSREPRAESTRLHESIVLRRGYENTVAPLFAYT